jgi:type VI secretion system protein ImpE
MSAVDAIRAGQLDEALRILQHEVRSQPAQQKHRVFLFQLLAIKGEWERALVQLNVAGELDVANLHMMHAYREALQCEALRQEIFDGKRSPLVFGDPAAWIAVLVDALRLDSHDNYQDAHQVRSAALESAPASSGTINGERFEWIADADSRLGPVLEVLINGRYYWVPFCRIKSIRAEAPVDLRDRVWMPVRLVWANEGETVGFIPTRYAGTAGSDDSELLLARKTAWTMPVEGIYHGLGQRMLSTDAADYPLMDVRSIDFDIVAVLPDLAQEIT